MSKHTQFWNNLPETSNRIYDLLMKIDRSFFEYQNGTDIFSPISYEKDVNSCGENMIIFKKDMIEIHINNVDFSNHISVILSSDCNLLTVASMSQNYPEHTYLEPGPWDEHIIKMLEDIINIHEEREKIKMLSVCDKQMSIKKYFSDKFKNM